MVSSILVLFLAGVSFASEIKYFPYYAAEGSCSWDGLVFEWRDPCCATADVTVEAISAGKPIRSTQTIDTDRRGDRKLFRILIDQGHRQELIRLEVQMGGKTYIIEKPRAGTSYPLSGKTS